MIKTLSADHQGTNELQKDKQWRIQDFPEEGALTPKGPTYYLANLSRKLHENEEILGQRGGASLTPPLRSATDKEQDETVAIASVSGIGSVGGEQALRQYFHQMFQEEMADMKRELARVRKELADEKQRKITTGGKSMSNQVGCSNVVRDKSPSDTTIYVPALSKRNKVSPMAVVNVDEKNFCFCRRDTFVK